MLAGSVYHGSGGCGKRRLKITVPPEQNAARVVPIPVRMVNNMVERAVNRKVK